MRNIVKIFKKGDKTLVYVNRPTRINKKKILVENEKTKILEPKLVQRYGTLELLNVHKKMMRFRSILYDCIITTYHPDMNFDYMLTCGWEEVDKIS